MCYNVWVASDRGESNLPTPAMNKKDLATLIDAYADAKASRNQHLVNTMVSQLEQALDMVFASEAGGDDVAPGTEASEF